MPSLPCISRRFTSYPIRHFCQVRWWLFPSTITKPCFDRQELFRFWRKLGAF